MKTKYKYIRNVKEHSKKQDLIILQVINLLRFGCFQIHLTREDH
jgi:hypothetical protein